MKDWKSAGRMECVSGISTMLSALAANIKINSKSNRNDLAVISEHTICGLLNRMYGWHLRNANTPKHPNFPSVDLVDEEAGVAIQVTVDNSVKKVDHTLEKFREYKLNRTFNRLILMVITIDEPTAAMKNREDGCFYGLRDIWNITTLTKEIEQEKDVGKLRNIAEYLEKELGYGFAKKENKAESLNYDDQPAGKSISTNIESVNICSVNDEDAIHSTRASDDQRCYKGSLKTMLDWCLVNMTTIYVTVIAMTVLAVVVMFGDDFVSGLTPEPKYLEQMPSELADYSVIINGEEVRLPITFEELENMGWIYFEKGIMENRLVPQNNCDGTCYDPLETWRTRNLSTTLTNGHGYIEVEYGNPTAHRLWSNQCPVYELTVSLDRFEDSYTGESINTLELPLGMTLGVSEWKDIDWPTGYVKEKSEDWIVYGYKVSEEFKYLFRFSRDTKKLSEVVITNKDKEYMAALLAPAYDIKSPDYDPEHLAEWLGMQIGFNIGGYYLPVGCPVQDYQEMGYIQENAPKYVPGWETEVSYFRCDAIYNGNVTLFNPFLRAQIPENCFVGHLSSSDFLALGYQAEFLYSVGEETLTIPLGITIAELTALLDEKGIEWTMLLTSPLLEFWPSEEHPSVHVHCRYEGTFDNITEISVDVTSAIKNYFLEFDKIE